RICCGRCSCCRSSSSSADDVVAGGSPALGLLQGSRLQLRGRGTMTIHDDEGRETRRQFLQQLAAASMAAWAAGEPRLLGAPEGTKIEHPRPTADSCILLWMAGGMAAPDTFDPKTYVPFQVGLPVEKVMSTFPTIDSAVDNIKLTQGLER